MMFELPDVDQYPLLYLAVVLPTSVSVSVSADGETETKKSENEIKAEVERRLDEAAASYFDNDGASASGTYKCSKGVHWEYDICRMGPNRFMPFGIPMRLRDTFARMQLKKQYA